MSKPIIAVAGLAIFGLAGLSVVFGSWYTVGQGERGVLLRNGAVTGTAEPGLGFKLPWVDSVVKMDVQAKARIYAGEQAMQAYSKDQQTAVLSLSVNYRIPADAVAEVYSIYGGEEGLLTRLVDRRVNEVIKTVFGQFNAVTSIQERARLNKEVEEAVQASVRGPIIVDSVQIENIDFSDAYEQSIEARMLAEVEVQKLRQNAEREKVQAEITVTQAKAQADAVRAEAEARAEATRLAGEAEADAIRAKGAALRDNPALIELTAAERWNGTLPTTMIPGGSTPFLGVK